MLKIRKAEERGHADHGWLNSYHTFSFADYHDDQFMGFGPLRVINDDRVAAGEGFGTHGHRDMEIISYVLEGALEHKDSMGNGRIIKKGDFQYMAAGSGVMHSEFNPSKTEPAHFLQIWIVPEKKGLPPAYGEKRAVKPSGELELIASRGGRDGSISINQDADLYLARLKPGEAASHSISRGRQVWAHVAEGKVSINGQQLKEGDAVAVSDEKSLELSGVADAQVLLFDLG